MEKFCMHCGTPISEGEKFCSNCGASTEDVAVKNTVETTVNSNNNLNNNLNNNINNTIEGKTGTNGLAIGSLVCSLCGLIVAGVILGIVAISLSIAAKQQLKVYKNQKGNGLATAGLVIGIVDVSLVLLATIIRVAALV